MLSKNTYRLVLASSSVYRQALLASLKVPFEIVSPQIDETALPNETPPQTALRLAELKAKAVSHLFPNALIIGSDQVACLENTQLGKPYTHDNAVKQLRLMRGKTVVFHTALCLLNNRTGQSQIALEPFEVTFRPYTDEQIERYLQLEQPYDCAGSAKAEGLGITLISQMQGNDPTALMGLPLIRLIDMLQAEHFHLF